MARSGQESIAQGFNHGNRISLRRALKGLQIARVVPPISRTVISRPSSGRIAFVPEGQGDRSLARSAWESPPQKSRPVGYGLILAGVRTSIR
jgi:hypothetical protein